MQKLVKHLMYTLIGVSDWWFTGRLSKKTNCSYYSQ